MAHIEGMSACAGESIIRSVSEQFCTNFDSSVQFIPGDLCAPFRTEASRLLEGLKIVADVAGKLTRSEDDLDKVAAVWKAMVEACDQCQKRLSDIAEKHPHCGAMEFHDEMLDLRNTCARLYQLHA